MNILEDYTHGMTNVCMIYMPGASNTLDQITAFVTYDVIGITSCGFLCCLYSVLNVIASETLSDRHVMGRESRMS